METITCKAVSQTFRNGVNGFTIFRATTDDDNLPETITVTGNMISFSVGKTYVIEGEWKNHPRYGRQFTISSCHEAMPATKKGIENYLSSGLVEGIGPVYAALIVDYFGEKTIEIIENEPERLKEVPGIGPKRAKSIADSCAEQKTVRDIMIFLKEYDIPNALAIKIYKEYGDDSIALLQENPYRLAEDIRGIGFLKADQIARNMGMDPENDHRLQTGMLYVLEQATETEGHTFVHGNTLLEKARELLGASSDTKMNDALVNLIDRKKVICEDGCVYLTYIHRSECTVAQTILRLLANPSPDNEPDDSMMDRCRKMCGITFSEAQEKAIRTAVTSKFSVMTGGPGTGKTTTTKGIISILSLMNRDMLLAAPTGRAAKRMSEVTKTPAQTIHKLLGMRGGEYTYNRDNPLPGDVLIIDESSMIDISLMGHLMEAVPDGMKVIMIGDVDQLPSVGAGNVLGDIIDSGTVPVSRLTEIFRQAAENPIIRNAHLINEGRMPELEGNSDGFVFVEANSPDDIQGVIAELASSVITENFDIPPSQIQVLCPQKTQACGTIAVNNTLQSRLNGTRKGLKRGHDELRPGDRVIQTRNNYDKDVMNGELGIVSEINGEEGKATVRYDGHEVEYDPGDISETLLAYAITVHKSQGSEFSAVIIPVSKSHSFMLQRPLLYTAVTRAKKLCVLVGEREAVAYAVHNNRIRKRNSNLIKKLKKQ